MKIRLNTRAVVKAYMPFPRVNTVITKDLTIDTDQEMEECRECDLSIEYIFLICFSNMVFVGRRNESASKIADLTSAALRMVARESQT